MVKLNKPKFFSSRYKVLVISPKFISLLEFSYENRLIIPINKIEVENNIFVEGEIEEDNFRKSLLELRSKMNNFNSEISVFVVLALPIFFVQRFIISDYELRNLKEALENKIKQELPINLNRYIWEYYAPAQKNLVFVKFFDKNAVNSILQNLIEARILPLGIYHLLDISFEFIKKNFSLFYESSYQIYIKYKDIFISSLYESGALQNIYMETISEATDLRNILKKMIESNIRMAKLPLDAIFISFDQEVNLSDIIDTSQTKIINITSITNLSPDEVASWEIVDSVVNKRSLSFYEIKAVDLKKELLLYSITNTLKISIFFTILLFLITNGTIFGLNKVIENYNFKLKKSLTNITESSFALDEISSFIDTLSLFNSAKELIVEKGEKLFYNLKDYKITQAYLTKDSAKLIIEETDANKKQEIKNQILKIYPNAQINELYNGLEINIQF